MNLSEPFIKRPVMTVLVMMAILVFGITAYIKLPVSDLPNVDYPTITVTASLSGASPETMANTIATPLEKAFTTISGLSTMTSTSSQGGTNIILQFLLNKSIDSAAQDIQAAIAKTLPQLPSMPTNPTYQKVNPSQSPILYLVLTSANMQLASLYEYANTFIGERLSMIPGVASVETYGSPYAVRIQANPEILAARGMDLSQLSQLIDAGNPNLPAGGLKGATQDLSIRTDHPVTNAENFQSLVIKYVDGGATRIEGIGQALNSLSDDEFFMHYITPTIDQPAVIIAVSRQPLANTVEVSDRIHNYLPELIKDLPGSIQLKVLFDKSLSIKTSVNEVKFTLILAFILVVLVIYLYLGKIADTVIPSLALPMSIIGTFVVMDFLGFTIDNLSLLALTLSIGFIVDDAIVVLENIVRHTENGELPYQAALKGTRQISTTVLTMTLALCAVFIPLLFMQGLLGRLFHEFAVTIVVAILLSGVISLTLTPMLCSRFVPKKIKKEGSLTLSERLHLFLLRHYEKALKVILNHSKSMLALVVICLVATIVLFKNTPTDFIPADDLGFMVGVTQTAQGSSASYAIAHQKQINAILRKNPNVQEFVSLTGLSSNSQGLLFVLLKPIKERKPLNGIFAELYPQLFSVPGVNTYLKGIPLIDLSVGQSSKGDYQYILQSIDPSILYEASNVLVQKMKDSSFFTNVSSDLEVSNPTLKVSILKDRAATYGITARAIEQALSLAYSGGKVSTIDTPTNQYDVILELEPGYQANPESLHQLHITSPLTGALVPFSSLITWVRDVSVSKVMHFNQFPAITISFSVIPDLPLSKAVQVLDDIAMHSLPATVHGNLQGTAEVFKQTISSLNFLLIVAVGVIYLLLGILYESFILPLTILSALPIAALGALLTLHFFGYPLSLYAFVGLILLIGIVQKNGIMMVDHALDEVRLGKNSHEAILEACIVRFRPIMMTTIAAIMGALPIALGIGSEGSARKPLGLVIVGGLIFAQLLTLFITPIVYLFFEGIQEKLFKNKKDPLSLNL